MSNSPSLDINRVYMLRPPKHYIYKLLPHTYVKTALRIVSEDPTVNNQLI